MGPGDRRRVLLAIARYTTVWEIDRSRIYSRELTNDLGWASVDAAIDRPAKRLYGIAQPHLGDGSSLQRVISVLSKRCGVPQRAFRRSAFALRATQRTARRYFRFYCRNRPSIDARTIRRGAMPRINSTVYKDERVGDAIRTDEPRPKTHRGA